MRRRSLLMTALHRALGPIMPLHLLFAHAAVAAFTTAPPIDGVKLRVVEPHELRRVAQLQLDIFAPPPEAPPLLPMLAGLFESNQRSTRAGMLKRLTEELEARVNRGSEILVALQDDGDGDAAAAVAEDSGAVDASGNYVEPGPPLLGTVDLSIQELQLPTHAVAGGLYLSHMAVAETARRRGIGKALLVAARECAIRRGEECIYLHVEPENSGAVALYEACGYKRQADVPPYASFTRALNLQERAVLYRLKDLSPDDEAAAEAA